MLTQSFKDARSYIDVFTEPDAAAVRPLGPSSRRSKCLRLLPCRSSSADRVPAGSQWQLHKSGVPRQSQRVGKPASVPYGQDSFSGHEVPFMGSVPGQSAQVDVEQDHDPPAPHTQLPQYGAAL